MFDPPLGLPEVSAVFPSLTVLAEIESGGQGAVFRVNDHRHGNCALKVYTPASRPRVDAEVALLNGIDHPNIIDILESDLVRIRGDSSPYILMPYVDGGSIRSLLLSGVSFDEQEAKSVLRQLGSAIGALWAARKVHRDIKPDNILVERSGRPVLIDFGVARHLDLSTMTVTGGAPGTSGYKSPEQSAGYRNLTYKSDVFSLGTTIYEATSRDHPFSGRQDFIDAGVAVIPLNQRIVCSTGLSDLVGRMLFPRAVLRPTLLEIELAST